MRSSRSLAGRAATLLFCLVAVTAGPTTAVINGDDDSTGAYSAVAGFGTGCSAVLIAPRVMLTSAHCMLAHALSCTSLSANPLAVAFAETDGGWSDATSFANRMIPVQGFVARPELFDLSTCANTDTYSCSNAVRATVDHSQELVVLYLATEAPAGVTPLPILVHPSVDSGDSAAEVGVFFDLESWVQSQEPVVTTVGYGVGSHPEMVGTMQLRGRDHGLQRWVETSTDFAGFLGATSCNALAVLTEPPGVVVSPKDLTAAQIGDPTTVPPGTDYCDSASDCDSHHSHSGGGDSGGPVLVGKGIAAKYELPTPLPAPGSGSLYDPDRSYVAGTASLWVGYGQGELATAFGPTWTPAASAFLMSALYDADGDTYADPVDDDRDGDGCANDVDQNPDDRWVEIGTTINPNCNPSKTPWLGDESLDSDGDGIPNCADDNDDGDKLPDDQDNCPVHAGNFCFKYGTTCPWNRTFFDCRLAGCNGFLVKLSSRVNPDPTTDLFFPILSHQEYLVIIAPAADTTVADSARLIAGSVGSRATADVARATGIPRQQTSDTTATATRPDSPSRLPTLEVVGPFGRFGPDNFGGTLAVLEPGSVRIGDLRGANALELKFGKDGRSLEITGVRVKGDR